MAQRTVPNVEDSCRLGHGHCVVVEVEHNSNQVSVSEYHSRRTSVVVCERCGRQISRVS